MTTGRPRDGGEQPAAVGVPGDGLRRRGAVHVEQLERDHPVQPEQPDRLGPVAPALQVPAARDRGHPHRVDVPVGGLVPAGHQVAQPQPAAVGRASPGAGQQVSAAAATPGRRRPPRAGPAASPAAADSLASTESTASRSCRPGTLGQRAQAGQQGDRLVHRQPQRPGDRLGVVQVDPAGLPVRLDQVVRQVPGRAADEQQLQVLDQLVLGDARSGPPPRPAARPGGAAATAPSPAAGTAAGWRRRSRRLPR